MTDRVVNIEFMEEEGVRLFDQFRSYTALTNLDIDIDSTKSWGANKEYFEVFKNLMQVSNLFRNVSAWSPEKQTKVLEKANAAFASLITKQEIVDVKRSVSALVDSLQETGPATLEA